jgi:nuclear pore complex protein Nup155
MLLLIAAANSRLALSDSSPTATGVNGNGAIGFGGGARSSFSVADHAKTLFFEYGGRPVAIDRGGYGGEPPVGCTED